jgi:SAM-dependent methyltransferase
MSADWGQGYVTDAIYTDGFYREVSPAWINYVAALKGCVPIPTDRPFTYLELGCGLGRSTVLLAGAFPKGRFIGVDFNPAHVALARQYAADMHIGNVRLLEASFQDLARAELPACDFIVLHGVYTWVSMEARAAIREILHRRLRAGGLVYVSYNCLPGWSAAAPIRKLFYEAAAEQSGSMADNVAPALDVLAHLVDVPLGYFQANGGVASEARKLKERGANYLAHEFLNADWTLFYSVDVADELAGAKLTYVGSATIPENHLDLVVDEKTAQAIQNRPTARMRQLLLDFATNQRFRRDIFVRGHQRLRGAEQQARLRQIPFISLKPAVEFTPKAKIGRREISFHDGLFPIIKEAFQHGARTIAKLDEIAAKALGRRVNVERTVLLMAATGHIMPCAASQSSAAQPDPAIGITVLGEANRSAVGLAQSQRKRQRFVSEIAGTAIPCDVVDAMLLDLLSTPRRHIASLADPLRTAMRAAGLQITRRGQPLADEGEELKAAGEIAERFVSDRLPVLARLGIAASARESQVSGERSPPERVHARIDA